MWRRLAGLSLVLALVVGVVACRPWIVVRLTTIAYADGSLERRLEVTGRTSDHEVPTGDGWLEEKAGIRLAEPDAWERIEQGPGWLRAEGFFLSDDDLPAILAMRTEGASRPAHARTRFETDDRVVLDRWIYVERHGDPYSAADSAAALEALTELAVEALTSEIETHFGSRVDPTPAQRLLRGEGRGLAQALLDVNRSAYGWEEALDRIDRWSQVLARYGIDPVAVDDVQEYWEAQWPEVLGWARDRIATELSTPEDPIAPDDLTFWPSADEFEERATEVAIDIWGSEEEFLEKIEPHLGALVGYYGSGDSPHFRFESRLRMPGTLLETNGTPDGDSVVWLFRERDLTFGEKSLRAESVALNREALTALGARREFDIMGLVRLTDLLVTRDPDGALGEMLARAVAEADLELLRDENAVPDEMLLIAAELADLLDPAVPLD